MNKGNNISSFDLSLLRKYVSKSLSDEETYHFNAFLNKHPEYKEVVEDLTLADLHKIEMVSAKSVAVIKKSNNSARRKAIYVVIAAAAVLLAIGLLFNPTETNNGKDVAVDEDNSQSNHEDLIALDTSVVKPESYQKEIVIDTFYYVNTDEAQPEVAIEYIEEKEEGVVGNNDQDLVAQKDSVQVDEIKVADKNTPTKPIKTYSFTAELDYCQSVAVESDYAQAYKVGQTKSFAGEIGGYEYDPEGMPVYDDQASDFYTYIENELMSDTLLTKISKKMEAKVSFEVNHKGKVENVNVVKCNHKQLCMKLTEIFENFPDWQPSDYKGKKGSVHYVIQVNYK